MGVDDNTVIVFSTDNGAENFSIALRINQMAGLALLKRFISLSSSISV